MVLDEYKQIAKKLLEDKPIRELGTGKVLCYRKPDEKEVEAHDAMIGLLSVIDQAKSDLEKYAVCGTCYKLAVCKKNYRGKRVTTPMEFSTACHKWKWRGAVTEE